jgi:hypothetical protein
MTANDPELDAPEETEPYEPEAPAHDDPDAETIVHVEDLDDEAVVDESDPAPEQPTP